MKVIGYLFYKLRAKCCRSVRFSLTDGTGRIKEQDKQQGRTSFMIISRGLGLLPVLLLAAGECHAAGVTIGVVAPQTGSLAQLGAQIVAGAEAKIRQDGDIVVTVNEPCEENTGAAVADALIAAKVQVAIGFLCSQTLDGALPKLKDANIPAITVSVRSRILMEDALKNNWPLFRLAPSDSAEAAKIIEVILHDWASSPIALIEDGTIHGRELTEAVRNALEQNGLKPVFTDTYRPGQEQQIALVRRLKKAGATKVFIGGDRSDVSIIARDARNEKIQLDLMGGDAMRAADQPLPLADGVAAVILPDNTARADASSAGVGFRAAGVEPEGYVLPAYAAVEIAIKAAQDAAADDRPVAQHLGGMPFDTVIGKVAFDSGHELSDNPYQLMQWRSGAFVPADQPVQ
jgi:branched-chain amino acid transport system substrate-binding protein